MLNNKIDFAVIFSVKNANPNGDPLTGNRPRINYDNYGEITDVCLKRKIRDRLLYKNLAIFVQSDDNNRDGLKTLKDRAEDEVHGLGKSWKKTKDSKKDEIAKKACAKWFDVRAFGQVFAFGKTDSSDGVSVAVRGPVTIQHAFSAKPVEITSTQITKSVSGEGDGTKKASDTMGMKHRIENEAIYIAYGSMSPQLAERTGFSNDDANAIKEILPKLFEGDASSARPEGSMAVNAVIWWQHDSKAGNVSSAKVHQTLRNYVTDDNGLDLNSLIKNRTKFDLDLLKAEVIPGF